MVASESRARMTCTGREQDETLFRTGVAVWPAWAWDGRAARVRSAVTHSNRRRRRTRSAAFACPCKRSTDLPPRQLKVLCDLVLAAARVVLAKRGGIRELVHLVQVRSEALVHIDPFLEIVILDLCDGWPAGWDGLQKWRRCEVLALVCGASARAVGAPCLLPQRAPCRPGIAGGSSCAGRGRRAPAKGTGLGAQLGVLARRLRGRGCCGR